MLVDEGADSGDSEANYGLLRSDFSDKPAAGAVGNLLTLLRDGGGSSSGGTVNYTLSGDLTDVDHLLLHKSDGTYVLLLWQNARVWDPESHGDLQAPTRQLCVELDPGAWQRATIVRPGTSPDPLTTLESPQTVPIDLPGDVMAVTLTPAG